MTKPKGTWAACQNDLLEYLVRTSEGSLYMYLIKRTIPVWPNFLTLCRTTANIYCTCDRPSKSKNDWRIEMPRGDFRVRKMTPEMTETAYSIVDENIAFAWTKVLRRVNYHICYSQIEVVHDLVTVKKLPPIRNSWILWKCFLRGNLGSKVRRTNTSSWNPWMPKAFFDTYKDACHFYTSWHLHVIYIRIFAVCFGR